MLVALSFLALAVGPLLVWLARRKPWSTVLLDAFTLVTVSGFALLHILPECAAQAGWLVLPLALVGFLVPTLAERSLHGATPGVKPVVLLLALLGMGAHTTLDGLFLTEDGVHSHGGHRHTHDVAAWGVILHRIPAGIGIWWIVPRTLGVGAAVLITAIVVGGTLFGHYLGTELLDDTSQRGLALLQAVLAGSLLHVVLHAHVPGPPGQGRFRPASVVGAALAAVLLWAVIHDHFPAGPHGPGQVFLRLAMESAPALLFAYLLVGVCHAFLPPNWLRNISRGPAVMQALRGVAVGLPLPVCSCGVVPIYRELVRQGASIAAAIAFLVATPELELAAVTLTFQLMGADVALLRVGMAAILALVVGLLVNALLRGRAGETDVAAHDLPETVTGGFGTRLAAAVRFGFGPAVDSTATWILAGLVLSALLMPYVDREWIAGLPPGIDVPIAALIGLPIYVCATGSTPLAAMLLFHGMSPGAVLAFLLTGPATNITTFGVVSKLHGGRAAVTFAVSMWIGAVGLGYVANWLVPEAAIRSLQGEGHDHGAFGWIALAALGGLFLLALLRQGVRPFLERLFESPVNLEHDHGGCGPRDHDGHGRGHDTHGQSTPHCH